MKVGMLRLEESVGVVVGLLVCNQSIRSIAYLNPVWFLFAFLVPLVIYFWFKKGGQIILSTDDLITCFFFFWLVLYSMGSLFETGLTNINKTIELCSLFFFFFVGRTLSIGGVKAFFTVVMVVGLIHAILLVTSRSYLYQSGVNYLLMSLAVGLSTCLYYLRVYSNGSLFFRLMWFSGFFIGWLGLLSMQSRAVVLFVLAYTVFFPIFILNLKKRCVYICVLTLSFTVVALNFRDELYVIYESSKVYARMSSLIYDFGAEPRFNTYALFFSKVGEFFLLGYGAGGTAPNIYLSSLEKYPHNFVLEFWSEYGGVGLIFSAWLVGRACMKSFEFVGGSYIGAACTTVFLFFFVNFMKSFTIYDSSIFFLSIGILFNRDLFRRIYPNQIKTRILFSDSRKALL